VIDIDDMQSRILGESFTQFIGHRNDDLFMQRVFSGHVDPWLWFTFVLIDDFLNSINLLVRKLWERFLDL